ncbi:hypothetical protein P43SY_007410 [Pythium insidiosum]|uniref:Uncharacterized protein n=1 Tax=Pythium insidiosum TaxID=114742 RepID=A0AAD5M0M4_PYTIN|nr:hypothetical protein P43SY_007410 [Pythium insidiosum]
MSPRHHEPVTRSHGCLQRLAPRPPRKSLELSPSALLSHGGSSLLKLDAASRALAPRNQTPSASPLHQSLLSLPRLTHALVQPSPRHTLLPSLAETLSISSKAVRRSLSLSIHAPAPPEAEQQHTPEDRDEHDEPRVPPTSMPANRTPGEETALESAVRVPQHGESSAPSAVEKRVPLQQHTALQIAPAPVDQLGDSTLRFALPLRRAMEMAERNLQAPVSSQYIARFRTAARGDEALPRAPCATLCGPLAACRPRARGATKRHKAEPFADATRKPRPATEPTQHSRRRRVATHPEPAAQRRQETVDLAPSVHRAWVSVAVLVFLFPRGEIRSTPRRRATAMGDAAAQRAAERRGRRLQLRHVRAKRLVDDRAKRPQEALAVVAPDWRHGDLAR